jgi:hypothetical protein
VPIYLYTSDGVIYLNLEQTPDPTVEKSFALRRVAIKDRWFLYYVQPYTKVDGYKYQGATGQQRRAAKAAGIRSPLLRYEFAVPIWMLMTIVAGIWWVMLQRRSRRIQRDAMALAAGGELPG